MIKRLFNFFVSLIILLHCVGVTQLVSAYSKDKSAYVGMLNMNEEETKKEKESKEDLDDVKDIHFKPLVLAANAYFGNLNIYYSDSKSRIAYQVFIENPTPPPDLKG